MNKLITWYNYHNDGTKSTWDKRCKSWKFILNDWHTKTYNNIYSMTSLASRLKTEKLLYIKWCVWTYIRILLWGYIHSKSIKSLSERTTLNFKKMVNRRKRGKKVEIWKTSKKAVNYIFNMLHHVRVRGQQNIKVQ